MIDELVFEDQAYGKLEMATKSGSLRHVHAADYVKVPVTGSDGPSRIAVIAGDGEILSAGGVENYGQDGMTGSGMAKVLKQVGDDPNIKGVILRVDSPGGDAIASAEILHAAQNLSARKPLLISMSDYAASGGYMMSMTGDRVLAYSNYTHRIDRRLLRQTHRPRPLRQDRPEQISAEARQVGHHRF
ncbi:MAG: S49 family peptidase [Acidobacteriota bacterium]